ncbi:MAG: STAS/SEC14 domain-containing protein [Geminicoccaceae bacterium]|nr:STAS/SEC14 domain-containing protein [Geminicoccaceae bacterium]
MIEILNAPEHVLAVRFEGRLTGEDARRYKGVLDAKLRGQARIGLCVDLAGLSDIDAEGLVEGAKADLDVISHLGRFDRLAIVSNKDWPEAAIRVMNPMLPTLEMRAFRLDRGDEAVTWVAAAPEPSEAATPAFRFLKSSRDDVLAFEIDGKVSVKEMPCVVETVQAFLDRHEKVRLLGRMKRFGGVDPAVFMQSGLVSMKLDAMRKVERYAVVGAPGWMGRAIEAMRPVLAGIDVRTFPADKEVDAWAWLDASPA